MRSPERWDEDAFVDAPQGGFAELSPGDTIGKFRVIRELGKGGMGAVYLAIHTNLQIEVALKILPPAVVRDTPQVASRFIREAQLAARIRHPNVVAVMDADVDRATGLYYIVLEYVPGGSLGDRLVSGPLDEDEALRVVYDVAQALVEAEKHGIVHRDIKPDNIMLDAAGVAKLADLGVAKQVMAKSTKLTQEGSSIGTPAYMSPDQIRNAQDADTRDDIYSLGATLYELLTGQPPFDGSTAYNIVSKVLSSPTPDPRDIEPAISPAVSSLCMKMMARNRNARHTNATTLINDLERLSEVNWNDGPAGAGGATSLHERPTVAGDEPLIPPSLEQMARRNANRYAAQRDDYDDEPSSSGTSKWVIGALLTLVLVAGGAYLLMGKSAPRPLPTTKNGPGQPGEIVRVTETDEPPMRTQLPNLTPTNKLSGTASPPATSEPTGPGKKPASGTATSKTGRDPKQEPAPRAPGTAPIPGKAEPRGPVDVRVTPPVRPDELTHLQPVQPYDSTASSPGYNPSIPNGGMETAVMTETKLPKLPEEIRIAEAIPPGTPGTNTTAILPPDQQLQHPFTEPYPPGTTNSTTTFPGVTQEPATPSVDEVLAAGSPFIAPISIQAGGGELVENPDEIRPLPPTRRATAFKAWAVAASLMKERRFTQPAGRLLKIYGQRPRGDTVMPTVWEISFYDTSANENYRKVTVVNGVANREIEEGIPGAGMFGWKFTQKNILDADALKIDSDTAMQLVRERVERLRPGLKITSAELTLQLKESAPFWRIALMGITPGKSKARNLGEAFVTVEHGSVNVSGLKLD